MYFVDFANFARRNLPEGWNDDIGGTFQLLDGRWYNSSRQYWRGNFTYESPFILLKTLKPLAGISPAGAFVWWYPVHATS